MGVFHLRHYFWLVHDMCAVPNRLRLTCNCVSMCSNNDMVLCPLFSPVCLHSSTACCDMSLLIN